MNASNNTVATIANEVVSAIVEEKAKVSKTSLKEELAGLIEVIVSRVSNKEINRLQKTVNVLREAGLDVSAVEAKIASLKATSGTFTDEEKLHLFDTEILPTVLKLYGDKA